MKEISEALESALIAYLEGEATLQQKLLKKLILS